MKILVADDDNTSRLLLAATLRRLGHEVFEARDGQEAWDEWQASGHQLMILDWFMPALDGLEVCRRIRAQKRKEHSYIILLTVRAGTADYHDAMVAGVDDFMTKPFQKEQLVARIAVAIRVLGMQENLRAATVDLESRVAELETTPPAEPHL